MFEIIKMATSTYLRGTRPWLIRTNILECLRSVGLDLLVYIVPEDSLIRFALDLFEYLVPEIGWIRFAEDLLVYLVPQISWI